MFKKSIIICLLFVSLNNIYSEKNKELEQSMRICSFNIRYGTAGDGLNSWYKRKSLVVKTIERINPEIFGVQEAMHFQLEFLDSKFSEYGRIGIGREGGNRGEFSAIYFKKELFELIDTDTFWFSSTPDVKSKDWDAGWERISTWGEFRDLRHNKVFRVYNNHWDHISKLSRINSAKLLMQRVTEAKVASILIGDFNASTNSQSISYLKNCKIENNQFSDTFLTLYSEKEDNIGTSHRFKGKPGKHRIDFIFIDNSFSALSSKIDQFYEKRYVVKRYPSDHFPVFSDIIWN